MAIKKRQRTTAKIEELVNELADKPYGQEPLQNEEEYIVTSISLPRSMLYKVEDLANSNKRKNIEPKNVSAFIRKALEQLITNN